MKSEILIATDIIKNSKSIVFFGGAGTSTESGIPDFRSKGGLYSRNYRGLSPEHILSIDFLKEHTDIFYDYLRDNLLCYTAQPNSGHRLLVQLEKAYKLKAIITQNIDGLHQVAGSENVLELHGTLSRFYCIKCGSKKTTPFKCDCHGLVRPDVVLYGEFLDDNIIKKSIKLIQEADTLIVAGTSLTVYPAAELIQYFKGENIIIINKSETYFDNTASVIIREPFGETMKRIISET